MEVIKIKNLTKKYKSALALNNISLSIHENELFGLLGINGAGKTTLIKILSGLINRTSGNAYIYDYDLDHIDNIKEIIDISPQETAIALNLTVIENLKFFQGIYNQNDKEYLLEIINRLSLNNVINKQAKTLSGGYQRRLSIAISLISKPKILFLDEPTLGLDVISRRELWKIIKELKNKITIILTSHYLEEIEELCDRVAILKDGNILKVGSINDIINNSNEKSFEDAFIKIIGGDLKWKH